MSIEADRSKLQVRVPKGKAQQLAELFLSNGFQVGGVAPQQITLTEISHEGPRTKALVERVKAVEPSGVWSIQWGSWNIYEQYTKRTNPKWPENLLSRPEPELRSVFGTLDILILTVTDVEICSVFKYLRPIPELGEIVATVYNSVPYYLGVFGQCRVAVSRSRMGSGGYLGSQDLVHRVTNHFSPKAIIAVGIAFGMDRSQHRIGDVLVSRTIQPYESLKIADEVKSRNVPFSCSDPLEAAFEFHHSDWNRKRKISQVKVIPGILFSGPFLINDPEFLSFLRWLNPSAIGGEMEGYGAATAAHSAKIPFIVVKGICDWADGDKDDDGQAFAAALAADLCHHVLSKNGVLHDLGVASLSASDVQTLPEASFPKPELLADTKSLEAASRSPSYGSIAIPLLEEEITQLRDGLSQSQQLELERAKESVRKGNWPDAVVALDRLLQSQSYSDELRSDTLILRARLLLESDAAKAQQLLDEAMQLNSASAFGRRIQLLIDLVTGGVQKALNALENATDPKDVNLRIEILLILGRVEVAQAELSRLDSGPESKRLAAYYHLIKGESEQALQAARLAAESCDDFSVHLARAVCLFYSGVSPIVLPKQLPTWPAPFPAAFRVESSTAKRLVGEAMRFFDTCVRPGAERDKDLRAWQIACLWALGQVDECEDKIAREIQIDPGDARLIQWAIMAAPKLNVETSLERLRADFSKFDNLSTLAEVLFRQGQFEEYLGLLEIHKSEFLANGPESMWVAWVCRGLSASGQAQKAEELAGSVTLPDGQALQLIFQQTTESLSDKLRQYELAKDPYFLLEACQIQAAQGDWAGVAEKAVELAREVRTTDALNLGLQAAVNQDDPELCLEILDQEDWQESRSTIQARCFALRSLGRVDEARTLAEVVWRQTSAEWAFRILASLYDELGELSELASLTRGAPACLPTDCWLALAQQLRAIDPNLACHAWQKAVDRGVEDQHVTAAFLLSFELGQEEHPRFADLASRFSALAAESKYGAQMKPISDLLGMVAERQRHYRNVEETYLAGGPVQLLTWSGISLAQLYHGMLVSNEANPNPDMQPFLLFRSGARNFQESLPSEPCLILDLTSALLAEHFNVLDLAMEALRPLLCPVSLLPALEAIRREVGSSQKSVDESVMLAAQSIGTCLTESPLAATDLCLVFPESGEAQNAVTARSLLETALEANQLSLDEFETACLILGTCLGGSTTEGSITAGASVQLTSEWARLLAQSRVLHPLSRVFRLAMGPAEAERLRARRNVIEQQKAMLNWVDQLSLKLHLRLKDGTLTRFAGGTEDAKNPAMQVMFDILTRTYSAGECIWADDRYASRHVDAPAPVVGLPEVLQQLLRLGRITESEYFGFLVRMRRANLRYIPLIDSELSFWLNRRSIREQGPTPCLELDVIRRHWSASLRQGNRLIKPDAHGAPGEWDFLVSSWRAASSTMIACIREESDYLKADWILIHLLVELGSLRDLGGLRLEGELEARAATVASLYWAVFVQIPQADQDGKKRRARVFGWLGVRFFDLCRRHDGFLQRMSEYLARFILTLAGSDKARQSPARALALYYLEELPNLLRDPILKTTDLANQLEINFVQQTIAHDHLFAAEELCRAIVQARQVGETEVRTLNGELGALRRVGNTNLCVFGARQFKVNDPVFELLFLDENGARAFLHTQAEWFDAPPEPETSMIASIIQISDRVARVVRTQELRANSPAVGYRSLFEQIQMTGENDRELLWVTDLTRLHLHFGLPGESTIEQWQPGVAFLNQGMEAAVKRAWGFPVPLADAIMDTFRALDPEVRLKTLQQLDSSARSPLARIHVLKLWRIHSPDSDLPKADWMASDGAWEWVETLLQVVRWTHSQMLVEYSDARRSLLLAWGHAHELVQALARANVMASSARAAFEEVTPPPQFTPVAWDTAEPESLRPVRFMLTSAFYIWGSSSAPPPFRSKLETLSDGQLHFFRGAMGSNVTQSWLGPLLEQQVGHLLGLDMARQYGQEALSHHLERIDQELSNSAGRNPLSWFQLAVFLHGPDSTQLCPALESVLSNLDPQVLLTGAKASHQREYLAWLARVASTTSVETRKALKRQLVSIAQCLSSSSTEPELAADSLYFFLLQLTRPDGTSGVAGFCDSVEEVATKYPEFGRCWLPGLTSLCWELPAEAAPRVWRCLVFLRTL